MEFSKRVHEILPDFRNFLYEETILLGCGERSYLRKHKITERKANAEQQSQKSICDQLLSALATSCNGRQNGKDDME